MREFLANNIWRQFATSSRTIHVPPILIELLQRQLTRDPRPLLQLFHDKLCCEHMYIVELAKKHQRSKEERRKKDFAANHDFFSLLDNIGGRPVVN